MQASLGSAFRSGAPTPITGERTSTRLYSNSCWGRPSRSLTAGHRTQDQRRVPRRSRRGLLHGHSRCDPLQWRHFSRGRPGRSAPRNFASPKNVCLIRSSYSSRTTPARFDHMSAQSRWRTIARSAARPAPRHRPISSITFGAPEGDLGSGLTIAIAFSAQSIAPRTRSSTVPSELGTISPTVRASARMSAPRSQASSSCFDVLSGP